MVRKHNYIIRFTHRLYELISVPLEAQTNQTIWEQKSDCTGVIIKAGVKYCRQCGDMLGRSRCNESRCSIVY